MNYRTYLADGTPLLFRLIRPDDKELMERAFAELSERSRYERFFTQLKRLSSSQLRYLTEVDHRDHSAWVALADFFDPPRGIGVGRWIRLPNEPEVAEVAVTVIDEFQRRGIGRTLLFLSAESARRNDVRTFRASILGDNTATLRMLDHMGAEKRWEAGVVEVTVGLDTTLDREQLLPLKLVPL